MRISKHVVILAQEKKNKLRAFLCQHEQWIIN